MKLNCIYLKLLSFVFLIAPCIKGNASNDELKSQLPATETTFDVEKNKNDLSKKLDDKIQKLEKKLDSEDVEIIGILNQKGMLRLQSKTDYLNYLKGYLFVKNFNEMDDESFCLGLQKLQRKGVFLQSLILPNQNTALSCCAIKGFEKTAKFLVERAELNTKFQNDKGLTPADIAYEQFSQSSNINWLKSYFIASNVERICGHSKRGQFDRENIRKILGAVAGLVFVGILVKRFVEPKIDFLNLKHDAKEAWDKMKDENDTRSFEEITRKEAMTRYRQLARKHHTDKGGSNDSMQLLNSCKELLNKYFTATNANDNNGTLSKQMLQIKDQ